MNLQGEPGNQLAIVVLVVVFTIVVVGFWALYALGGI